VTLGLSGFPMGSFAELNPSTSAAQTTTFTVDAKTQIAEGRKTIALSELQPGREVKVTYEERDGAAVVSRIDVMLPMGGAK